MTDDFKPGDNVVIEQRDGCRLCLTGVKHLAGEAGLVEEQDLFWTEIHANHVPGPDKHRVYRVRTDLRAAAPVCERMLRRHSIHSPAARRAIAE